MNAYNEMAGGQVVAVQMLQWAQVLSKGDFTASAEIGNQLLSALSRRGADNGVLTALQTELQTVITSVQKAKAYSSSGGCADPFGAKGTEGAIDWYQPDLDKFYALDARSGVRLRRILAKVRKTEALFKRRARVPNRLLFVGDPGTGKTAGAKWLATQLGLPLALVRIDGVVGAKVGETAARLRACFEEAGTEAVLLIDEVEAVAVDRGTSNPNVGQWNKDTTSALNQLLDSLPPRQVVIGCTNVPQAIDSAVLRRFRTHVYFYNPDRPTREAMLKEWWSEAPYSEGAWRRLIDKSEGQSGDFLERVAEDANSTATLRGDDEPITAKDVAEALDAALATKVAIAEAVAKGVSEWEQAFANVSAKPSTSETGAPSTTSAEPKQLTP